MQFVECLLKIKSILLKVSGLTSYNRLKSASLEFFFCFFLPLGYFILIYVIKQIYSNWCILIGFLFIVNCFVTLFCVTFSLQGNQETLYDVKEYFSDLDCSAVAGKAGHIAFQPVSTHDQKHGRTEERDYAVSDYVRWLVKQFPQ
jgi:hypothetical protein